jgi:hypothetical protein
LTPLEFREHKIQKVPGAIQRFEASVKSSEARTGVSDVCAQNNIRNLKASILYPEPHRENAIFKISQFIDGAIIGIKASMPS